MKIIKPKTLEALRERERERELQFNEINSSIIRIVKNNNIKEIVIKA